VTDEAHSIGDIGAGHVLGRYELLVPIAQGGMAVVWAARMKGMRRFQKIVAIKSLLPMLSMDPTFERMFMSEAELASKIRHPNCCEILDLGEQDDSLYIVMEWINGDPLFVLRREAKKHHGGVPVPIAARIASAVAAGLHAAHELKGDDGQPLGLVHRDVSPQNIMVTPHGEVKILDFGVAKATQAADAEHTRAGQIKGKVPFMAPEQALGRPVDRRTDVFSLGIVLFQLVTSKHPFKQKEDLETLRRICDKSPVNPPSSIVDHCPRDLELVICKALEKNPEDRFQTMDEFRRALDAALTEMTGLGLTEDDVGVFASKVLKERSEKRQKAINEAMRIADERAAGRDPGSAREAMPSMPGAGLNKSGGGGDRDPSGSLSASDLSGSVSAVTGATGVEQSGRREVTQRMGTPVPNEASDFTPTVTPPKGYPLPGPNLPGPNLPGPNLPGPNLPGPNLPGPNLPGPGVMPAIEAPPGSQPGPVFGPPPAPIQPPGGFPAPSAATVTPIGAPLAAPPLAAPPISAPISAPVAPLAAPISAPLVAPIAPIGGVAEQHPLMLLEPVDVPKNDNRAAIVAVVVMVILVAVGIGFVVASGPDETNAPTLLPAGQ